MITPRVPRGTRDRHDPHSARRHHPMPTSNRGGSPRSSSAHARPRPRTLATLLSLPASRGILFRCPRGPCRTGPGGDRTARGAAMQGGHRARHGQPDNAQRDQGWGEHGQLRPPVRASHSVGLNAVQRVGGVVSVLGGGAGPAVGRGHRAGRPGPTAGCSPTRGRSVPALSPTTGPRGPPAPPARVRSAPRLTRPARHPAFRRPTPAGSCRRTRPLRPRTRWASLAQPSSRAGVGGAPLIRRGLRSRCGRRAGVHMPGLLPRSTPTMRRRVDEQDVADHRSDTTEKHSRHATARA